MRLIWIIFPLVLFSVVGVSESFAQDLEIIPSLKHQLESSVAPEDITCRDNNILVLRTNGNFACVKETTSEKLGWKIVELDSKIIEDKSNPDPKLEDSLNVIDANNQFAIDFYSQVSQENEENIFFSPWSISTAFAIAFEGAKGNTADEIRQVFGFPSDYEKRTNQFKSAMDSLNPNDSKYQLSVANALWLADKFEPFTEYVDTATNFYDSEVSTVDFVSNDGVEKINAWVEDKTQEKIKDILAPGSTNEDTRLAITNAIYFKGNWVTQFNENNTSVDTFWNGETSSEIPLMHLESTYFNYTQTEQFQILKMPYEGDRLSMLVLLPNENDALSALEESLSIENLDLWREQLTTQEVEVFMPKFKLETTYDLVTPLVEMGMPTPFSEGVADFSGIAPISLFISQAIHKAFVDVNEEGTEAAAATVIVFSTESVKLPPPVFRADHPFVFLIQDDSTGNILFIGRMTTPSE
jgi:serpin B